METNELFAKDHFAKHAGIESLEAKDGHATARMPLRDEHMNGLGIAHGGAIYTLADMVLGAASNSHGYPAVALSASIHFVKSARAGDVLHADARELHRGRRVSSYEIRITNNAGELVATLQGLAYRVGDTK